jgi:hypothetical protein
LIRSVSTVTTAAANVSSVFQLLSFLVVYSGMILKGFGFVALKIIIIIIIILIIIIITVLVISGGMAATSS